MAEHDKKGRHLDSIIVKALLWVDKRSNVDRFYWGLVIFGLLLAALDFLYHKHVYFQMEHFYGFYALYGFFMCAALVIAAKAMRGFLQRDEDYYAPKDVEAEAHPEHDLERKEADV